MNEDLVSKLRIYALDLHLLWGFNRYSAVICEAADYIEEMERKNDMSNLRRGDDG